MARIFAYLRVSTIGQTTENQKREIAAAGIEVEDFRIVAETVSGGVAAMERLNFARLVDRLEPGCRFFINRFSGLSQMVQ